MQSTSFKYFFNIIVCYRFIVVTLPLCNIASETARVSKMFCLLKDFDELLAISLLKLISKL